MPLTLDDLSLIYPEQLLIAFSEEEREKAWQKSHKQSYSNAAARWNAYLNSLCLNVFLTYLEKEADLQETAKVLPNIDELPSFAGIVNGTAIQLGETRLILIPGEQNNFTEFRVQREWVELPNWVGNYYLALDLNLEACWLRVWGYATHQQLIDEGRYDRMDETYSLDADELIEDLSIMWTARELYPRQTPKVKPIPTLSSSEAEALLDQLSQQTPYSPRLDVSFSQWGALIANDNWRRKLYQRRQQQVATEKKFSTTINLGQWFQEVFEAGWQSLDALLNTDSANYAYGFRNRHSAIKEERNVSVEGAKLIDLGMKLGNQSVVLLVGLTQETKQRIGIRVQLYPTGGQTYLPSKIKLALLSPSGAMLQESIARTQDNLIQLKRFTCPTGKNFSLQVALDDFSITEDFKIDSLYERK
ncbi:MAG: DUF1822 family protein [Moorea sp. SIO2B7]|nr:DUF1822 family protein [Moorena sp. SIO2B7]